jgi:hypothetical protein
MNVRTMVRVLVAPALLVALANPAEAATPGVLAFTGTIRITPTAAPSIAQTDLCFLTAKSSCANGVGSTGVAAGAGVAAAPEVLDGVQGKVSYSESCLPEARQLAPTGTATITANVHRAGLQDSWSAPVTAQWFRGGLVAVIQGGGTGAAVFAPMGVPSCGTAVDVAVTGSVELAY